MSSTQLSVVIITLNEEKNIGRCLASVIDVANEIIVVDSFSTDKTQEICQQYNVNFIQRKWEGFAQTKNFANQQAKYDYVLSLDADEALSLELSNAIKKEKEKGLNGAYEFNRLSNYCGKWIYHCGWYPDKKIRLFPKQDTQWEGDFIHEILRIKEISVVSLLKGNMLHYSYYTIREHKEKTKQYANLGADKIISKAKKHLLFKAIAKPCAIESTLLGPKPIGLSPLAEFKCLIAFCGSYPD